MWPPMMGILLRMKVTVIIERQADAMATALLMPLPQVKKCFYRLRSGRSTEQLIYEMSRFLLFPNKLCKSAYNPTILFNG